MTFFESSSRLSLLLWHDPVRNQVPPGLSPGRVFPESCSMDLIIRHARLSTQPADPPVDIGIAQGRIAAIVPGLAAEGREFDAAGGLVCAGLIETHIHLDKSRIIER